MGKCSCGLSEHMPKCDGNCKNKKKSKKEKAKKSYKKLKKLCESLLSYVFLKDKLK